METALIVVEKIDPVAVFTNGGIEPVLDEIRKKATDFEPDVTTDKGRKEIASMAYKVSRSKTLLDDLGKTLVADWKAKVKKVDSARKQIRDNLDALKDEVREPLNKYEEEQERIRQEKIEAEEKRVRGIRGKIEHLKAMSEIPPGTPSAKIKEVIDAVQATAITDVDYEEFIDEAQGVWERTLESLQEAHRAMAAWEEEQRKAKEEAARLEAERKQAEEAAAKLKAEQEALEAERRKIQEEKDRIEREKKAEQERKEREEFERKAQEEARAKAEQEAKERAEREAREAKERAERGAREKEERERREAEEKARQEALRPDKEKLLAWIAMFDDANIPSPQLTSEEAFLILNEALGEIEITLQKAKERTEAL